MRALAVDPGGTTGFAVWERSEDAEPNGESFRSWMIEGQLPAVNSAWGEATKTDPDEGLVADLDVIVCESFTISTATAKKTRGGSNAALEIIGALRWQASMIQVPFVLQAPSDASAFCSNEKLKRLGWYTPGPDHARSAARHLVLYLVRGGYIAAERLLPSHEA